MAVQVVMKDGDKYGLKTSYIKPKSNSWNEKKYKVMQEDTSRIGKLKKG